MSGSPDPWPAHIAGHPPAATLTFVLLDRIGLRGGGWAGAWCITVGATACAARCWWRCGPWPTNAWPGGRRRSWSWPRPPVWVGASADGYFAAVAAWSVALTALAVTGRSVAWAAGGGLLSG